MISLEEEKACDARTIDIVANNGDVEIINLLAREGEGENVD